MNTVVREVFHAKSKRSQKSRSRKRVLFHETHMNMNSGLHNGTNRLIKTQALVLDTSVLFSENGLASK